MRRPDDEGMRDALLVALTFSTGAIDAPASRVERASGRRAGRACSLLGARR
jgi:hypothetical protein